MAALIVPSGGHSTLGAYGLALPGLQNAYLQPAEPSWPTWTMRWAPPPQGEAAAPEEWSPHHARLLPWPGGTVHIDRASRTSTFLFPQPPSPDAIAHPLLASTAVVAGNWLGRTPLHAGAFVLDGRVWGVLGGKRKGKTSTLMGLHLAGVPVVADDVLVVDAQRTVAFAGPRCLDLREDAAERFGKGRPIGVVGARARWRVVLPAIAQELPLAGWVLLEWAESSRLSRPSVSARLAALAAHRGLTAKGSSEDGLLELLALPMVLYGRPRNWEHFDKGLRTLLGSLADQRGEWDMATPGESAHQGESVRAHPGYL